MFFLAFKAPPINIEKSSISLAQESLPHIIAKRLPKSLRKI